MAPYVHVDFGCYGEMCQLVSIAQTVAVLAVSCCMYIVYVSLAPEWFYCLSRARDG